MGAKVMSRKLNKKAKISERNQKLLNELNSNATIINVFTKQRIITYFSAVFIPPYGLYRIWNKNSELRNSEKYAWTALVLMNMFQLLKVLISG